MVKILCIVQARLTSTRLPNKVLMELGNSHLSILEHVNERLLQSKYIDKIVFAIPDSNPNNQLADFLTRKKLSFFRGSENDVLERFFKCANHYKPQIVVRATCDNPFVDWKLGDFLIERLGNNDFVGCKDTPIGTSLSVFTMAALKEAYENAHSNEEHEHVTPYIYKNMKSQILSYNGLSYRLTVDEERDFYVATSLYSELYRGYPIPNEVVYDYLANHPDLANYNRGVHQKQLGE